MSEQAKHTPGPWNDGRTEVLVRGCQRVGLNLAFVNTSDAKKGAEAEANARLIAAAPDLLAVLQSLMPNTLIGESYDPPVPADEVLKEFLFTWGKLRAARSAIAKALGQDGESAS